MNVEMELCVEERAFKSSLRGELPEKSTQQAFLDDYCCAIGVPGEDFFVDDLLDLSNAEFEDGNVVGQEEEQLVKDSLSGSSSQEQAGDDSSNSTHFSGTAESESHLASELAVPDDDLAELEWVSHFVDDSPSGFSLSYVAGKQKAETLTTTRSQQPESRPRPSSTRPPCFSSAVPSKTRTKRARTSNRVWTLGSGLTESPPPSSASSPGFSSIPCLIFTNTFQKMELFAFAEPPTKKQKKKPRVLTGGTLFQRRCSHCQVQKTPQWRTGPLGPKTLCNACGVRFKSGRLFPEYRPACSPTFSGNIHSNSHRKVLEIRKRKEMVTEPGSGLTQMVPSF
ncbi:GATA transcription factor 5-like isoform X1 [Juglans microcarpa x Juglans regia]|uniref:GATA transcription factor 5-like isoform X1 n=2 Tax=Juglans microcarpa x Juglans regia TaxID=2249226 RepID=UPI001B7EA2AE|nr:GATA transcription factor 5-like isoform X1 [Juglans microcarpa x Juglans regia]